MPGTETIDIRLLRIGRQLDAFLNGDFSARETLSDKHDELDDIISKLNRVGESVQGSGKAILDYERRVTAIMEVLMKYTFFDFNEKAEISDAGDEIDAIAVALNTLGEELNDRIQAEKKHTEELEKLAVVIETTADAVISFDPKGTITHWNRSAERIYGYKAEEMVNKHTLLDFTPPECQDDMREMLARVTSGHQLIDGHTRRVRKDGTVIDVSVTLTPVIDADGKVVSISGVSRDITAQKKQEQTLRESEARYRNLVENVKDYAILTLDPEGNIVTWNAGAEKIKGYKADEIIGKHFSIFYTEKDRRAGLPETFLAEARENGKAFHEGYRVRKDGTIFWGAVVITSLRDESGKLIGYSKITRDLTESKLKDEEIRRQNTRLEQKNVELEKINKELASFAYVSSHDLQEPLRKIQTFASRVLETDENRLSDNGKNYFARIRSAANRMQQLLQDILDYSRLSTHEHKVELTDLAAVAAEVKEEFAEQIAEKKGRIEIGAMCTVPIVSFQFKQLLTNLVSNAIKFARREEPPVIKIKSEVVNKPKFGKKLPFLAARYCHVSVSDNGIGFESKFANQIFEVFQRLHGQDAYPGTGIGLAICKKIVDNHNGVIEAESKVGEGSTFNIYIPYT